LQPDANKNMETGYFTSEISINCRNYSPFEGLEVDVLFLPE